MNDDIENGHLHECIWDWAKLPTISIVGLKYRGGDLDGRGAIKQF